MSGASASNAAALRCNAMLQFQVTMRMPTGP
jgi:hypothetical protein